MRIALLAPADDLKKLKQQLNELVHPHDPKERRPYLPTWPGFESVFRIKLAPADDSAQIPLPATLDDDLSSASNPRQHLAGALIAGLRKLDIVRDRFDVVVFYLPHRFQPFFEDKDTDFDLHDTVKAVAAQLGLTTQIVTDDALTYRVTIHVPLMGSSISGEHRMWPEVNLPTGVSRQTVTRLSASSWISPVVPRRY